MKSRIVRTIQLCLSLSVAAGYLALVSPAQASPPADTALSLRVLTYNTAFLWADLPGPCGSIDINDGTFGGMSYAERAHEISQAILATDNDVVVLNEVFSDPVKKEFVDELKNAYPSYVSKISKQLKLTIANPLLAAILGPVAIPCTDWLSASQTTTLEAADSGLMIFVKKGLKFAPFSSQANPPYDVATVEGSNNGAAWGAKGELAVDSFEFSPDLGVLEQGECYTTDCLSSKAAAMVRIQNLSADQVTNLAFTHTQAWNGKEQVKVREEQFGIMKRLITDSLTPAELTGQPLYVTGDLNVPGQNKANGKPGSEWTKIFNSASSSSGNFFACGLGPCGFNGASKSGSLLTDGWGFETSTNDQGVTNADDGARLDYFLHNHNLPVPFSDRKFCLQHVMRAYDLEATASPLSDHVGVRADVNRRADHCSANDDGGQFGPKPVTLDSNGNFGWAGNIQFKGGMQWLKLNKGQGWDTGSYVFTINPSSPGLGVDFDIYESTDLSNPIPMFSKDPNGRWVKYSLPDRPYYIRVFATDPATGKPGKPDRTRTGTYKFTVHENRGLSPGDAIAIDPADEHSYPWPMIPLNAQSVQKDNATFAPDTEIWHEFFTDTATAGTFPDVDFLVENNLGIDPGIQDPPFSFKLRDDFPGQPVLADVMDQNPGDPGYNNVHDYDRDGNTDYRLDAPDLAGSGSGPKKYFLTLRRNAPAQMSDIESVTTFRTTLTYIKSLEMFIEEEKTFGPASDEAKFQWAYDGSGTGACQSVNAAVCLGPVELDDGWHWATKDSTFQGSFTGQLTPNIWEDGDKLQPQSSSTVAALSKDAKGVNKYVGTWDNFIWGNAGNAEDAGYWYQFRYCLSHKKDWVAKCKL